MVHGDPHQRTARLAEVTEILKREAPPEDLELLLSLAPIFFADMPARLALDLPAAVVAARLAAPLPLRGDARCPRRTSSTRACPASTSRSATPREEEARALGGGAGLPLETTIVETHTPDRPFIFDSLKNYLQKQGLRVFSAIHPIFTVRRQWERIVALGDVQEEGSKESYCFFQIERVAVARAACGGSSTRCSRCSRPSSWRSTTSRTWGGPAASWCPACAAAAATRPSSPPPAPSSSGSSTTTTSSWARSRYARGARRHARAAWTRPRTASSPTPALLPVVFPGVVEHVEAHLQPAAERRPDPRPRLLRERLGHLPPRADRGPHRARVGRGREARRASRCCSAASPAGPSPSARTASRSSRRRRTASSSAAGPSRARTSGARPGPPSTTSRRPTSSTPTPPTSSGSSSASCTWRATTRSWSRAARARATRRSTWPSRGCATPTRSRRPCGGPSPTRSARWPSAPRSTAGPVTLLIFYFDSNQLEHPVDVEEARRLTEPLVTDWEDRVGVALEREFGEREGRRLFRRYVTPESRSGLYREVTAPEQVPDDLRQARGAREPARGGRRAEDVGDGLRPALPRCARSTSPTS